jgi:hypothetical protein
MINTSPIMCLHPYLGVYYPFHRPMPCLWGTSVLLLDLLDKFVSIPCLCLGLKFLFHNHRQESKGLSKIPLFSFFSGDLLKTLSPLQTVQPKIRLQEIVWKEGIETGKHMKGGIWLLFPISVLHESFTTKRHSFITWVFKNEMCFKTLLFSIQHLDSVQEKAFPSFPYLSPSWWLRKYLGRQAPVVYIYNLSNWEAEIRRIKAKGQPVQKWDPISKVPNTHNNNKKSGGRGLVV